MPIFKASHGNKMESLASILWAMGLTIPILIVHAYFMDLQTYVYVSPAISLILQELT
jgi:hypothetical protein